MLWYTAYKTNPKYLGWWLVVEWADLASSTGTGMLHNLNIILLYFELIIHLMCWRFQTTDRYPFEKAPPSSVPVVRQRGDNLSAQARQGLQPLASQQTGARHANTLSLATTDPMCCYTLFIHRFANDVSVIASDVRGMGQGALWWDGGQFYSLDVGYIDRKLSTYGKD